MCYFECHNVDIFYDLKKLRMFDDWNHTGKQQASMIRENRQLVTNEPVKFEK